MKKRSKTKNIDYDSNMSFEKRVKQKGDAHSCDSADSNEDKEFHIY